MKCVVAVKVALGMLLVVPALADEFSDKIVPVLQAYCYDCHDGDSMKPKGDFDLFPFYETGDAKTNLDAMLQIRNALHFREMPPENKKQPGAEERDFVIDWIDRNLLLAADDNPGPPQSRRMTRLEYNNTLRDLLGLSQDVFSFPERLMAKRDYFDPALERLPEELSISIPEYGSKVPSLLKISSLPGDNRAAHGFFNQGDVLNVSPLLVKRYVSVADDVMQSLDIARDAPAMAALFGVEAVLQTPVVRVASGSSVHPAVAGRDFAPVDNIEADAPGSSDQAWLFRDHISAAFDTGNGGVFQHVENVGARVKGKGHVIRATFGTSSEKAILINPTEDLWFVDFATAHETSPPANISNGVKGNKVYGLGFQLDGVAENEGLLNLGVVVLSRAKEASGTVTLTAHFSSGESASLSDEIGTGAGKDNTFFSWYAPPGTGITKLTVDGSQFSGDYVLIDDLGFITGRIAPVEEKAPPLKSAEESSPAEPSQTGPVFESEEARVRAELTRFLKRAFRGPVTEEEVERYQAFYRKEIESGQAGGDALRETVRGILSSPRFLFLTETGGKPEGGDVRALTPHELASRLSYFLWSSMPDAELFGKADDGSLADPAVLEQQVRRMLRDPKVKELSDSFAFQWLRLNILLGSQPNPRRFRDFYYGNKGTMAAPLLQEALLLFETVLIENRPVFDLVDPGFTWLNPQLINYYGFSEQYADLLKKAETVDKNGKLRMDDSMWFRCELPDRRRGGVLTLGSTLTLTSLPLRTSPVYRGAWVTEVIFNRAPPPPPAMVDELGADDQEMQDSGITLRQKLAAHREKQACAGCHTRIDPFGFPLENFDPVGLWRDSYGKFPVDAGGTLMREHEYSDIIEFKDAIAARKSDMHRGFIRYLLTYALGRKLKAHDEAAITAIEREAMGEGKGLQDLVVAIAKSYPFNYVRVTP
jgi:hypothetical protein